MATKVLGVDRLNRKLSRLPEAVEAEIRKAMEEAAQEIVDMAKRLVPVDEGDLRDSIGWTWGEPPRGSITIARSKPRSSKNPRLTIYAGNDKAFHARFVEFGTSPHLNKGLWEGTEHPGTAAQPFFYVSYRARKRSAKGKVSRAITKAAKRVATGG